MNIERGSEKDGKHESVERETSSITWSNVGTRKIETECEAIFDNIAAI